jgi:hypothetical protein
MEIIINDLTVIPEDIDAFIGSLLVNEDLYNDV